MNCINCGTKLDDGAVFCDNCGAKVTAQPAAPAAAPAADVSAKATAAAGKAKAIVAGMSTKMLIGVGVAAVAVIAIGATLLGGGSPVEKAILANVKDIQSESKSILETLPATKHLMRYQDEVGTLAFELDGGDYLSAEGTLTSDIKGNKAKVEFSMDSYYTEADITAYANLEHVAAAVEMGDFDEYIGINLKTLQEDLDDFDMMNLSDLADVYNYDVIKNYKKTTDEMTKLATDLGKDVLGAMDTKKIGKEEMKINGEKISAVGYEITWNEKKLEKALLAFGDELKDSKYVADYLNMYLASASLTGSMPYDDLDDMLDSWEDMVDDIMDMVEQLEDEDMMQMVYIYKGRAVLICALDEDMEYGAGVAFNPKDNILDYIAAVSLDEFDFEEMASFTSEMGKDSFDMAYEMAYGSAMELKYDFGADKNEIEITDGYNDYELVIDTSEKNTLEIETEMDGIEITATSTIGGQDKKWFDLDEDYDNLLQMDEDDLRNLAMSMY